LTGFELPEQDLVAQLAIDALMGRRTIRASTAPG